MRNNAFNIHPVKRESVFKVDNYITWGGSMARTPNGKCHLFFSMWPYSKGHDGWVTSSVIGYALADEPLGPYKFQNITLQGSGKNGTWDQHVTHNPNVIYHDRKFYLYYMGNTGNGEYWNHRNNQRIGVAIADSPEGPWTRFDKPVLDVSADRWDCIMTSNPSVTRTIDGLFIMIYKACGNINPAPQFGPVYHGVALSDSPSGPFKRHPKPIFTSIKSQFPGEDPFIFFSKNKLYTILKDMDKNYTNNERALVLFESTNGVDWKLSDNPLVTSRVLAWDDGKIQEFDRLERPQLYLEDGYPSVLFCAAKPYAKQVDSYNIHIKVS